MDEDNIEKVEVTNNKTPEEEVEERRAACEADIKAALGKYEFALSADLVYGNDGIIPRPSLRDIKEAK